MEESPLTVAVVHESVTDDGCQTEQLPNVFGPDVYS